MRCLIVALLIGIATPAAAQDHRLHLGQAGALLDYAEFESRLLYAAVTARVFDLSLTQSTVEELNRSLTAAKKSLDRADALLPEGEESASKAILSIRNQLVQAERQLQAFSDLLQAEAAALDDEDAEVEEGEARQTDWQGLKSGAGWLAKDVRTALSGHRGLAKRMGIRVAPAPAPRGERPAPE